MEQLAGMRLTGRQFNAPSSDLIELQSEEGELYTAVVYDEKYRKLPVLTKAVDLARSFMEFPMVAGLVEMSHQVADEGAFIYPTGDTRSVAELIHFYRDSKQKISKKAILEMVYLAAMILNEAADTGPLQGVYSHADLDPSRILVKPDGDVQIIGYGIPSPALLEWLKGSGPIPRPEGLRYTPPERITGAPEEGSADLYALALIAIEMAIGQPLFDGTSEQISEAIHHGRGPHLLAGHKGTLGKELTELFTYCLNFDPATRYESGQAFVTAVSELLDMISGGEDLADVIRPVHERTRGQSLRSVSAAASRTGRSMRPTPVAEQPQSEGRWARVSRVRKEEPEPEPEEDDSRRRRRSRRTDDAEEAAGPDPSEEQARRRRRLRESGAEEAPEDDSRRRRSRRGEEDEAPAAAAPAAEEDSGRRRRSRRGDEDEAPAAATAAPAAEEESGRRRTRRGGDDEAPAATPAAEEDSGRRRTRRGGDDETPSEDDSPRRRRLRESAGAEEAPAADATPAPEAGDDDSPRSRRRRLRESASDEEPTVTEAPDDDSPRRRRRRE